MQKEEDHRSEARPPTPCSLASSSSLAGAAFSLQLWGQATVPYSLGPCSAGLSCSPGALLSGLAPPPASPAHTSSGSGASPWQRLRQRRAKSDLPEKAQISEKGQKPCFQTLLHQHTGVRPASHSYEVTVHPGQFPQSQPWGGGSPGDSLNRTPPDLLL